MTKARLEYLKNIPLHERYLRNELKRQAKNIKGCKVEICWHLNAIKDRPEIQSYKTYMELLQVAKKTLKMHKAFYMAVKRLLPKRKPAKRFKK